MAVNLKSREDAERTFLEDSRKWRTWNEKYEKAEFKVMWTEKELALQGKCRQQTLEILENAKISAFTAQKSLLRMVLIRI